MSCRLTAAAVATLVASLATTAVSHTTAAAVEPPTDRSGAVSANGTPVGAPFVSRMSARFQNYTDAAGKVWLARSSSLGTLNLSTALMGKQVGGTDDPGPYSVNAFGVTAYRLVVPRAATYRVRLLMAEDFFSRPGQRVFDVHAEEQPAQQGIDIAARVGKATALDVSFPVQVVDGRLDLRFVAKADLPLISAIEVTEVGGLSPQRTFAHRMTAQSVPITDSSGQVWERMGPGFGSRRRSLGLMGKEISGTTEDALYQVGAFGGKGMLVPVPAKARYSVRLLMAESYWNEPGRRIFDVLAEGKSMATDVDIVDSAGKGAAHEVRFDVEVHDGMLTIQFLARQDNPLVSAIEVTSNDQSTAVDLPRASLIPLPATSVYHRDVRNAPVAENSTTLLARLRDDIGSGEGHNATVNAYQYNAAFYRAHPNTPRYTVEFDDCQKKGYVPNHLHDQSKYFVDVPVPLDATAATGRDGQLGIYDPSSDSLWEFWQTKRTPTGGWSACWGGRIDNLSTASGVFPEPFGVSASGLVMAGGVIGVEEAARGEIDHALYLTVKEATTLISYPANRTDGTGSTPDLLTEGQRLRLDPALNVTTLGLSPMGEVIARAAQKYGFIVSDRGESVAVATQSGRPEQRRTGINPWDVLLGGPTYLVLEKLPWDRVEALPLDYGKPTVEPAVTPKPTESSTATPAPAKS